MSHTVVGFFKQTEDAEKAVSQLQHHGITREQVNISRSEYLDATADRDGRNTNMFTDIFNKLFGHDNDNAKRYSTIGQRDVTMVTVHATSNDLAEKAADVLDDCGAIDVDEHDERSGSSSGAAHTATGTNDLIGDRSADRIDSNDLSTGRTGRRRSQIFDRSLDDLNFRGM